MLCKKGKNVKLRLEVCHKVPEIETIYLMPCRDCTYKLKLTYLAISLTDTAVQVRFIVANYDNGNKNINTKTMIYELKMFSNRVTYVAF